MVTSVEVPTVWNQLAENMYLKDSPTATVRLSKHASYTFGRVQNTEGLPELARPLVGEHGHIIVLQLRPISFIEQFLGRRKVASKPYPAGAVSVIDLQEEPSCLPASAFDAMLFYIPRPTLDEIYYDHHASRMERLAWPHGAIDPVVSQLGQLLLPSLDHPSQTSKIFVDHVLQALNSHFVCSYGGVTIPQRKFRGGLTSWQMRRATEMLEAHLGGNIALQQVAEACELSVSHFARAFKESFRKPPYRWLLERRVDRARDLMTSSRLPLADIAVRCGFTDEPALNRSFKRTYGVTPGAWRRENRRSSRGLYISLAKACSSSVPRQECAQVASSIHSTL
jgi:AraC family transcriptional regulator